MLNDSFSRYRYLFTERRQRLTFDHLKQMFIIMCNSTNRFTTFDESWIIS